MNPRISFAFARGARVQYFHRLRWVEANFVPSATQDNCDWRTHPNDEWMQYGLLSTMLRNSGTGWSVPVVELYGAVATLRIPFDGGESVDQFQWRMYLLIMAEALADEGL